MENKKYIDISKKIDLLPEYSIMFWTMWVLNFITVCYVAIIPSITQWRASRQNAVDFMKSLRLVPMHPWNRIYLAIGCFVLIYLCYYAKKQLNLLDTHFLWISIYEVVLVAGLMMVLDMSYTGMIFLIAAEYLNYVGFRKHWMFSMAAAFFIYLLSNYNLVTILLPFNSFESWANFYPSLTRSYILGIRTSCETINIMLFLVYVAMVVLRDKKEKKQIRALNQELRETNMKLKDANDQLKDANDQLHRYALEKEQMGETRERNRLAREIHDTLGHILTGISVGVDAVQVLMDVAPDAAKGQLTTIGDMARNGLNDVRRSVRKLKPDSLESRSLDHAIYQMVDEMSKTTGAKIYFVCYGEGLRYEADEEETIFRMVQEGTTNALRHGKATEVWIRLDKKENDVEISLIDNGAGCPDIVEGFGLTHMRERVEMLGGRISFSSNDGFAIQATIPIRQRMKGDKL